MDDLTHGDGRGRVTVSDRVARVATLPSPDVVLGRRERAAAAHRAFMLRADAWAQARAGDGPVVVEYPRDAAVVAALGVPCEDCGELVHEQGGDGHAVLFEVANGEHWAARITARCGRLPA